MESKNVTLPELAALAATRAAGGAGLGLLLAPKLGAANRRKVGWALLGLGVLSTIPIAVHLFGSSSSH
jgi:hypothetical protein